MNPLTPVSDIMTREVITISADASALEAKQLMRHHNIHHLPIVDGDQHLVGILSDADTARALYSDTYANGSFASPDAFLAQTKVGDIMVKRVAKVKPNERIDVVALIFNENRIHSLPIVEDERLVGIVTSFDLIRYAFKLTQEAWK